MRRMNVRIDVPSTIPNTENGRLRHRVRDRPRETPLKPLFQWCYVPRYKAPTPPVTSRPERGVLLSQEYPESRTQTFPMKDLETL